MRTRNLGKLEVSAVGLGAMGFSHGYGPGTTDDESIDLMRKAFDLGCTFFDTAEVYANGDNEKLVGQALAPIRDHVVIATKLHLDDAMSRAEVSKAVHTHLDASLTRLGVDHVDLYYQHRVADAIPVEDVAEAMGQLIAAGKILGWGQSQATVAQIRTAHAITPLTAIQSEYSMMERMFEADVIPTCAELGIGFVPFQPARQWLPLRKGHRRGHLHRRRRPAGHHPLREGQHPRQPATAGPARTFRHRQGRNTRANLAGLDAAQGRLHRPHPGITQARTHRGEPRCC